MHTKSRDLQVSLGTTCCFELLNPEIKWVIGKGWLCHEIAIEGRQDMTGGLTDMLENEFNRKRKAHMFITTGAEKGSINGQETTQAGSGHHHHWKHRLNPLHCHAQKAQMLAKCPLHHPSGWCE